MIEREEALAAMFLLADAVAHLDAIRTILEGDDGREEEEEP